MEDLAALDDADLVAAIAVPVANNGSTSQIAKLDDLVTGIKLFVAVCVQVPGAGAIYAQLVAAVAIPITRNRRVVFVAEVGNAVSRTPAAIAIEVAIPLAAT